MKLPSFIAEMGSESNRRRLHMGTRSGFALALAFGALTLFGQLIGAVPASWSFYALVAAKLATNTLARIALHFRRGELELGGLNVAMDVVVMTGAIYLTGGQLSPLFPIYLIELTVIALLTNMGITVLIVVFALVLYTSMALLSFYGVIPTYPPPFSTTGPLSGTYVVLNLVFAAFVVGVPTFFTAGILRQLRAKEQAIMQRRKELAEAGRQKSQFMANITHELRTPIHGICGLSDLVSSGIYGPLTDKQSTAQGEIKRSAQGLLHLIDDLLLLAKSEAGRLSFQAGDVDLDELLPSVAASTKWMIGTQDLSLEVTVEQGLPWIVTDRSMLTQVLVNLLSNAVKFTPEGGQIAVRASRRGDDGVAIEVSDTGIGIDDAQLEAIFEQFKQSDGSLERSFGGVGLGLAMVRRLTRVMGGRVEVRSEPGKGSTFTVSLPMQGPDPDEVAEQIARESVVSVRESGAPPNARTRRHTR